MASSRLAPKIVRLATTRISLIGLASWSLTRCPHGPGCGRRGGGGEDAVDRTRHPVLVWSADYCRQTVEVEDRRRGGHGPLQRHAAPRVGGCTRAASPAGHHVVEEHQRAQAEREARDRDEEVEVRELDGVGGRSEE